MSPWLSLLLTLVAAIAILGALKAVLRQASARRMIGSPAAHYRLRDDLISRAEAGFYHQLCATVDAWAVVFPKVNLGDLFYATGGSARTRLASWNRINRKHVDFVLCHPQTLHPIMAIELDDSSHAQSRRVARDRLVDDVFAQAGLPVVHIPCQASYSKGELADRLDQAQSSPLRQSQGDAPLPLPHAAMQPSTAWASVAAEGAALHTPLCPRCGAPMVRRVAQHGERAGQDFWGCPNYPRCRGTRQTA